MSDSSLGEAPAHGEVPAREVLVDITGGVATISLNRPAALNALNYAMKGQLLERFLGLARDRSVRAIVLTGAGRAFSAGQDLRERLEPGAPPLDEELTLRYNPIIRAIRDAPQPVIAAVNGVAAGAGASLAFACDLRIASESASFVLAFGRIGLVPDSGATWTLPRLVGAARAAEIALLGDSVSASDAQAMGLVSRVVPADVLAAEADCRSGTDRCARARGDDDDQAPHGSCLCPRSRCGAGGRSRSAGHRGPRPGSRRGAGRVHRKAAAAVLARLT